MGSRCDSDYYTSNCTATDDCVAVPYTFPTQSPTAAPTGSPTQSKPVKELLGTYACTDGREQVPASECNASLGDEGWVDLSGTANPDGEYGGVETISILPSGCVYNGVGNWFFNDVAANEYTQSTLGRICK